MNTPSPHQPEEWEKDFEKLKYRGAVDHASAVGFIRTILHTERQAAIAERDAYWKEQEMGASHDCYAHAEDAARLAKAEIFRDIVEKCALDINTDSYTIYLGELEAIALRHNITSSHYT